jgi:geranylgeranyl pyrophosphate synthase
MNLQRLLDHERKAVDRALESIVSPVTRWPERLHRAMAYAVLAGGKRVRPILARLSHQAAGADPDVITEAACGLELIHTYSLVHDDLPAMDDDSLRRGQPTVHVAFDEATAILAGDALMAEGFLLLASRPEGAEWAVRRAAATALVAEAISARGMAGGQMADMEATGQIEGEVVDPELTLERIHRTKTGCLIRASVEFGAVLAGVEDRSDFVRYGEGLGLAFQVSDDVLDAVGTADEIGKTPGKDADSGKLTYVTLYGLDAARAKLAELEAELIEVATSIEGDDGPLSAIATYVIQRSN